MESVVNLIIGNLALDHIAQTKVTQAQLDADSTIQAEALNRQWVPSLKAALRGFNWSFAKVHLALVEATYTPLVYDYAYDYPADCLAIRKIFDGEAIELNIGYDFKIMYDASEDEQVIVTNLEDAYAEYTHYIIDTTQFDSHFIQTFSHILASNIAIPLNADEGTQAKEIAIFNTLISEAQRQSSMESKEKNTANQKSYIADSRG